MSDPVQAPFTPEQVAAMNAFQARGDFHPFTCGSGNRGDAAHLDGEGRLVATADGWVCPYCDYRQDWAHGEMAANPAPAPPVAVARPPGRRANMKKMTPEQLTDALLAGGPLEPVELVAGTGAKLLALERAARAAKRAVAKEWPIGTPVRFKRHGKTWAEGRVNSHGFNPRTGACEVRVRHSMGGIFSAHATITGVCPGKLERAEPPV